MRTSVKKGVVELLLRSKSVKSLLAVVLAGAIVASGPFAVMAASADAFEADNTLGTARDVGDILGQSGMTGYFGEPMGAQTRTFHFVDDGTPASDEDWVRFSVDADAISSGFSYVFEAVPGASNVSPVLEIYGPGTRTPTPPGSLGPSVGDPEVTQIDPVAIQPGQTLAYNTTWMTGSHASLSFLPQVAGVYYVRIRPYYQHAGGTDPGFRGGDGPYTLRMKTGQMSRLAGDNRFRTAIAVSQERFPVEGPESGAAVLANGYAFPDALSGSTLAGAVGGPVLLTPDDRLPDVVRDEILRLGVDTVYVLGGPAAVSDVVVNALAAHSITVVRVAGDRRAATARQVAKKAAELGPTARLAFIVNSHNFPDALAASPMAAYNAAPILLTREATLDPEVEAALKDPALGITDVVIVGGEAVISRTVRDQVAAIVGSSRVLRLAGNSRYETARHFGIWATGVSTGTAKVGTVGNPSALETLDFARIGLASGENFPDALAGGVLCGLAGSPILLTPATRISPWVCADFDFSDPQKITRGMDYWFASDPAILRSYVFGGTAAVSQYVHEPLDVWTGPVPF